jgi:hypothetical protein
MTPSINSDRETDGSMKTVALLGAGFSYNWGCWLASELTGDLLGRVAGDPDLHARLRRSAGFEDLLDELQVEYLQDPTLDSERRLNMFQEAVLASFTAMNEAIWRRGSLDFTRDRMRGVCRFLSRFDVIFTLNQDLLLERLYSPVMTDEDRRERSCFPGMDIERLQIYDARADEIFRPTGDRAIAEDSQPIFKLHGSVNWRERSENLLVMGRDKRETIARSPLLSWYFEQFCLSLAVPGTRLMVIGYSFRDPHINDAILTAHRQAQLELFLVDPRGTEVFRVAPEAPQLGLYSPLNDVMLIGESRRPLSTTFAGDDLEWAKLNRFFGEPIPNPPRLLD